MLSVFDQSKKNTRDAQVLNIDETCYQDDADIMYLIHRLTAAAADADVRTDMNVEDEYFSAIEDRDTAIMKKDQELKQRESELKQKESEIKQKDEEKKKQEKFLKRLATEYVIMGKECERAEMKEAAITNYQKALTLYPGHPEAKRRLKHLKE